MTVAGATRRARRDVFSNKVFVDLDGESQTIHRSCFGLDHVRHQVVNDMTFGHVRKQRFFLVETDLRQLLIQAEEANAQLSYGLALCRFQPKVTGIKHVETLIDAACRILAQAEEQVP